MGYMSVGSCVSLWGTLPETMARLSPCQESDLQNPLGHHRTTVQVAQRHLVIPARPRPVDAQHKKNPDSVEVQAVWFRTDKWTLAAAKTWLTDHDFKTDVLRERMDEDGSVSHYIFAQFDTSEADDKTWATLSWWCLTCSY